jgi:conjugative transfer signal peptidase TraF
MWTGLLDRLKYTDGKRAKGIGFAVGGLFFSSFVLAGIVNLRFNASPSLPVGLYIVSADPDARLVEFCPAEPYASLATSRGYRTGGTCPDGASPFMKQIVAKPGDTVDFSPDGIAVNGRLIVNTQPRDRDSAGRPLEVWPFGSYRVAPGTLWVASAYHPRSFDSRYFGPIPTASIRNHVRPLLTAW